MKMDVEVQRPIRIKAPTNGLALGQSAAQLKELSRLNDGTLFIVSAGIPGNVEQFGLSRLEAAAIAVKAIEQAMDRRGERDSIIGFLLVEVHW